MEMKEFIEKFAEAVDVDDPTTLTPEMSFRELEEWNSMAVMMLIAMYEEEFRKEIFTADIRKCDTIKDLYNLATI